MHRRRLIPWLVGAGTLGIMIWQAVPYVRTAAFLLDMSGTQSAVRRWLPVSTALVAVRDLTVPTRAGLLAARAYVPLTTPRAAVIVFPGIHAGGVDEPRLDGLARRMAGTGLTVVTVPLPDLRAFHIVPTATDEIEDAIAWMASTSSLAPAGRVAVVGVSFGGGLAIVAAGRPAIAGRILAVVSLGGHADLPRTMRYLCTGQLPDGTIRPPHDYGAAVILLAAADRLVPADQVTLLRTQVTAYLDASSVESTDPARAEVMLAPIRDRVPALPEPTQTLMRDVTTRDVASLGPKLLPFVDDLGSAPALSPDRSPAPTAPVFLLHGLDDNVIPSSELPLLAEYLRSHGTREVTALTTPFLTHATMMPGIGVGDGWALLRFWRKVFATAVLP